MKKEVPVINRKRLDEVLNKISGVFVEEKLSPFEIKICIDVIYNNLEKLDDIFTKAQLNKAISGVDESKFMGVS